MGFQQEIPQRFIIADSPINRVKTAQQLANSLRGGKNIGLK
jgi:hypothetical protein